MFLAGDRVINHTLTGCGCDLSTWTDGEIGRVVFSALAPSGVLTHFVTFTDQDSDVWQFYPEELTKVNDEQV